MNNSKYVEFVNNNIEQIAEYVNQSFEQSKEYIRMKLIRLIKAYLVAKPIHYVNEDDGNPYDCSGILVKDGYVSFDQTVTEFLQEEYTGDKEPTYISGMGWHYNTYADDLSYDTINIAYDIMLSVIRRYIENEFTVALSDDDFEDIKSVCRDFDDIYDNCIASDFFFGEPAVEFCGLSDIKLRDLMKTAHKSK